MQVRNKIERKMTATKWNSQLTVSEYTQRRMTFGMHTGKKISELPLSYIKWGILNLDDLWAGYFARELQRRKPKFI